MEPKQPAKQAEAKIHVLVADDELDVLRMLRTALMRSGYKVTTAKDGAETLARLRDDPPDVLVLDILFPDFSGLEILDKLKSQKATENLPVILLTQCTSYKDIKTGYNYGADFYITKPFKVSQVIEGIKIVTKTL